MALAEQYVYTDGFNKAVNEAGRKWGGSGTDTVEQAALTFNTLFKNLVGRDPSADEANQFYTSTLAQRPWEYGSAGSQESLRLRDTATQFINDNYQSAMEDEANKRLVGQQAEAGRLSDLFRSQGNEAINSMEASLLDYQSKLFERLRPNLITSLQAQGLLNTGGLNQAVVGAQNDFATEAGAQVANAKFDNDQQANAIKFAGEAAPYEFKQAQILGSVPYARAQGQGALQNLFQQRLMDQEQANWMARLEAQSRGNGSKGFFKQIGSTLAPSFGQSMGQNLGAWFAPKQTEDAAKLLMGGI